MKVRLTQISPLQTTKVLVLLYALVGVIYSIIGIFMVVFGSQQVREMGWIYIFMPIIMVIIGFPLGLFCCWLYNVVAKLAGGIEFTLEEK